ncbi:hypothetical protein BV20DRAFT_939411 [Pilatotrama ljubarskyi]|nr:hypothetical protein BV20DRAFT_939411 [Pilatotrama ljubarskyi]
MYYRGVALPWSREQHSPIMFHSPAGDEYTSGGLVKADWANLCIAHRTNFHKTSRGALPPHTYPWAGLVRTGSDSSLMPMTFDCPCEVIVPGWSITSLERKHYSLWLSPSFRCHGALSLQVGFPTSPAVHTLALCNSSEVILVHVGRCPAFEQLPIAPRYAYQRPSPQVLPALCVSVAFNPPSKVVIPTSEEDEDPHLGTCWMDHIDSWEDGKKVFKRGPTTVQIEFKPCPGAWTHQQQAARTGTGRPMFIMRIRVNPKPKWTGQGSMSATTGTSLH